MIQKTIWKWELEIDDLVKLQLPKGAEILTVQAQFGKPCLWAMVNPKAETEERLFETFGTGHPIPYDIGVDRKYIGTYQVQGGGLVFHLFELKSI